MESTIAAISTAYGEGGIGIIRISGEKAKEILCGIFTGKDNLEDRIMIYGHIKDPENGEIIDEVMAVYMKAPKTYTKEDIVEINCHGSTVSLRKTLDLVLRMGAVPAEEIAATGARILYCVCFASLESGNVEMYIISD